MVERLGDAVSFYKIGLQLLAGGRHGRWPRPEAGAAGSVFLDWKLHDIGATVERATAAIAAAGACDFITVHAEPQVLAAAVQGPRRRSPLKILGVTVLTSLSGQDLGEIGYGMRRRRSWSSGASARCLDAGADGVVVSPREAALARRDRRARTSWW